MKIMKEGEAQKKKLIILKKGLSTTIRLWEREVNTEGNDFDFESQDSYKIFYEDLASQIKLYEKYPIKENAEDREKQIIEIKRDCKRIIELYETHKNFFRTLDREKIMFATIKKRNPTYYKYSDNELGMLLLPQLIPNDIEGYYKSEFYNDFGFLVNDYHFEINNLCKHFLSVDQDNANDENKYNTFKYFSKEIPFFSMGLIYDLYELCNGKQFEEISELEFYLSLNLMNIVSDLRLKKSVLKTAYYVLHMLSSQIEDPEIKTYWLNKIQNKLGIEYNSYKSRYMIVKGSDATLDDTVFAKNVDTIFLKNKH